MSLINLELFKKSLKFKNNLAGCVLVSGETFILKVQMINDSFTFHEQQTTTD